MASKHAARLGGDDYQHLYSWWLILSLKLQDEPAKKVIIENGGAGQVDDVTVHYETNANLPDRFYQVKYHVNQGKTYSGDVLIEAAKGKQSLLEKFWTTWQKLYKQDPEKVFELYLVSNYAWNNEDALGEWISGLTDKIDVDEFMQASSRSNLGKIRQKWQSRLGASDEELKAFLSCLHFRLGYSPGVLLHEQVVERMRWLRLKTDPLTLDALTGFIRNWIKNNRHEIDLETLNILLKQHELYLPDEQECCTIIHLITAEMQTHAVKADHVLDWRERFVDAGPLKGRQLKDPSGWNKLLLPKLYALRQQLDNESDCRLLKVRGQAWLPIWFAFGYVFSSVTGYKLAIDLPDQQWRTDTIANEDFAFAVTSDKGSFEGEALHGEGGTVVLGIGVETPIDDDVRHYLQHHDEQAAALLLLQTKLVRLRNAGDAVAMAEEVRRIALNFVRRWRAHRLLLFYRGPAGGACFIGYRLHKVCDEIQIMAHQSQRQSYTLSFLLQGELYETG